MWRGRAPAYIYLTTDGPTPVKAANCCEMAIWGNKGYTTPFVDGLLQETCRDSGHANLALSAMVNAAETARQQGLDLYAEQGKRIMAALEYQAQFLAAEQRAGAGESGIQQASHLGNRLQPFSQPARQPAAENGGGPADQPAHRRQSPHGLGNLDPCRHR